VGVLEQVRRGLVREPIFVRGHGGHVALPGEGG
jgi:hypothetical protein